MMKWLAPFLLVLPLYAQVVGEFEIYVGSYEASSQAEVIVSFTEGRLIPSYGPSVAEEIKETFNLKSLELISAPRVMTDVGKEARVRMGPSISEAVDIVELTFLPTSLKNDVVHMKASFRLDDMEPAGAEFTTQLNKPVTLASRIDGQIVFILCRVMDQSKLKTVKEEKWDMPPKVLKKVNPVYPESMRKAALSDVIVLELTIGTDGKVHKTRALKGEHEEAIEAAVAAVKQWEWEPAQNGGKPVEARYVVTLAFKLQ